MTGTESLKWGTTLLTLHCERCLDGEGEDFGGLIPATTSVIQAFSSPLLVPDFTWHPASCKFWSNGFATATTEEILCAPASRRRIHLLLDPVEPVFAWEAIFLGGKSGQQWAGSTFMERTRQTTACTQAAAHWTWRDEGSRLSKQLVSIDTVWHSFRVLLYSTLDVKHAPGRSYRYLTLVCVAIYVGCMARLAEPSQRLVSRFTNQKNAVRVGAASVRAVKKKEKHNI